MLCFKFTELEIMTPLCDPTDTILYFKVYFKVHGRCMLRNVYNKEEARQRN